MESSTPSPVPDQDNIRGRRPLYERAHSSFDSSGNVGNRPFSIPRKPVGGGLGTRADSASRMSLSPGSEAGSSEQHPSDDEASGRSTPERRLLSIPLQTIGQQAPGPPEPTVKRRVTSTINPKQPARYGPLDKLLSTVTFSTWWLEIGACFSCLLGLIAIIVTMLAVNDKPLPQLPFSLSINTLIAIFVAISQGSIVFIIGEGISQSKWAWFHTPRRLHDFLIYDEATRGPWGALKLIWDLRGRAVIASLGALITVSALLLDPVSQQLIQLYDCFIDLPIAATIPRTNVYDFEQRTQSSFGSFSPQEVVGLIGSAPVGMFSMRPTPPPYSCETGNCTFTDTYTSMGYCSKCSDVQSYLRSSIRQNPNPITPAQYTRNFTGCVVQLDIGPFPQYNTPGTISYYSSTNSTYNYTFWPSSPNSSTIPRFFSFYDQQLAATTMVWWDNADPTGSNCSTKPIFRVYQCLFHPCAHTFRANITNNVLNETVLARELIYDAPEYLTNRNGIVADLNCAGNQSFQTLRDLGYTFNDTTKWLKYNVTWDVNGSPPGYRYTGPVTPPTPAQQSTGLYREVNGLWSPVPKAMSIVPLSCIYSTSYPTTVTLESGIPYFLTTNLTDSFDFNFGFNGGPVGIALYTAGSKAKMPNALTGVQSLWQNMSDSMTTFVRTHGNINASAPVKGATTHYAVCVQVQWPFLTYIAIVTFLLLTFFVSMIIQTRWIQGRTYTPINAGGTGAQDAATGATPTKFHNFKSNALAVLFHGLDDPHDTKFRRLGGSNRVKELEYESMNDKVVMVNTPQGWKLCRVDENGGIRR